jgi:hypothetical protein
MGLRVKDEGGSECRPVMGRTGVEPAATSLHAKAGRLPSGVGGREPSANRRSKQSRTVGEVAMTSAGAACTTEVNSVAGPCRSDAQADSMTNGATAFRKEALSDA